MIGINRKGNKNYSSYLSTLYLILLSVFLFAKREEYLFCRLSETPKHKTGIPQG